MSLNQLRIDVLSKIPFGIKPPATTRRATGLKVRLRQSANRHRATADESIVVDLLSRVDEMPLETLLALVADALYREELCAGAATVDLGLFGSRLFVPDARRALETGDGELWEIG